MLTPRILAVAAFLIGVNGLLSFGTSVSHAQTIDSSAQPTPAFDRAIDEGRAAAVDIRKLSGKHLVLFTDLAPRPAVDELPAVFDAAFPQWCEYLGLDAREHADWQMRAFLMSEPARFRSSGLIPVDLPKFLNGYTRDGECWLNDQTSDYYRRHLLLHEGTHGIMFALQKSNGPPWYMEGIAELLATHRWQDGKLQLRAFPNKASDVPKLGRIEIVQADLSKHQAKQFVEVMAYDNRAHLQNEPYAWSWAAAAFLDGHPKYQQRFRKLVQQRAGKKFNAELQAEYRSDGRAMLEAWQAFVSDLDYGYDFERTRLDFEPGRSLTPEQKRAVVEIAADRGWQNSKVQVEAGKKYTIAARGQFVLAKEPKPWISEAGGVTLRYHRGLPLGTLIGAIRSEQPAGQNDTPAADRAEKASAFSFVEPTAIGTKLSFTAPRTGTLYLRLNDSSGELHDNTGAADVAVLLEP